MSQQTLSWKEQKAQYADQTHLGKFAASLGPKLKMWKKTSYFAAALRLLSIIDFWDRQQWSYNKKSEGNQEYLLGLVTTG